MQGFARGRAYSTKTQASHRRARSLRPELGLGAITRGQARSLDVAWIHRYDDGMTVAKVAVSVPEDTLRAVEKRRRALGMSRSAVVSAALASWLADQAMTAEERTYVAAYLKQPEDVEDVRETTAIGAAIMAGWDPWCDAPTTQAVAKDRALKGEAGPKRSKPRR